MTLLRSIGLLAAAGLLGHWPANAAEPTADRRAELAAKLQQPFTNRKAFEGVPLEEALGGIGKQTGVRFLIDTDWDRGEPFPGLPPLMKQTDPSPADRPADAWRSVLPLAAVALPAPAPVGGSAPLPDRRAAIAARLLRPFSTEGAIDRVLLAEVLDIFREETDIEFVFDKVSFRKEDPTRDVSLTPVSLPVLREVRLRTALRLLLEPIDARYLVMPDHILITTAYKAAREAGLEGEDDRGWVELAHLDVRGQALEEVFREIGAQTGANVVLDPAFAERGRLRVTVRMYNAAPAPAVRRLAAMAGLGAIEQGNTLYVTSAECAREWLLGEGLRWFAKVDPEALFEVLRDEFRARDARLLRSEQRVRELEAALAHTARRLRELEQRTGTGRGN